MKRCRFCAEEIQDEAVVARDAGGLMRWAQGGDRAANLLAGWAIFGILGAIAANLGDKRFVCPNCGTLA